MVEPQRDASGGGLLAYASENARAVITLAQRLAAADQMLKGEHVVRAILRDQTSASAEALSASGISEASFVVKCDELRPFVATPADEFRQILEAAERQRAILGHSQVGVALLLIGVLETEGSLAATALHAMEATAAGVLERLSDEAPRQVAYAKGIAQSSPVKRGGPTPTLDEYGTDHTARALAGSIDPVIGRDSETEQVLETLVRRTKSNVALVGEPGVGKTAIVEGLACRIARGTVPAALKGMRLVELDLTRMVAGAKFRGDFEERVKKVVEETIAAGNVILFIDEFHTLVGAGRTDGGMDAANILKPPLARGQLKVIGATTLNEYRIIEKDPALERRFDVVRVEPPSPEAATEILRGLRPGFEQHHGVRIADDAVSAAVRLSERYIGDRYLPDKAIDLLDRAAAGLQILAGHYPVEMTAIRAEFNKLKAEEQNLRSLTTPPLDEIRAKRARRQELADRHKVLAALKEQLKRGEKPEVTEEHIRTTLSERTGIPVTKTKSDEMRAREVDRFLASRVIGQGPAVDTVAQVVRNARAGLNDPERPLASLIFVGPTGVGKTEMARALAEFLFGDEEALVRLDMSEFMEKHQVARLIGSPPGYVGSEDGGQLTEAVRRKPYSIVLFDEIEKAHPDVCRLLLQVMDAGHLTDSKGRKVSFRNTAVLMTSNLGAGMDEDSSAPLGFHSGAAKSDPEARMCESIDAALKQHFAPEFLNRLDEVVVFNQLHEAEIGQILTLQLKRVVDLAASSKEIALEVSDEALSAMREDCKTDGAYVYGARPVKRLVKRCVTDVLANALVEGRVAAGDQVLITWTADAGYAAVARATAQAS